MLVQAMFQTGTQSVALRNERAIQISSISIAESAISAALRKANNAYLPTQVPFSVPITPQTSLQGEATLQCAAVTNNNCAPANGTETSDNILTSGNEIRETLNVNISVQYGSTPINAYATLVYRMIPGMNGYQPVDQLIGVSSPQLDAAENRGSDYASCDGVTGCGTTIGTATPDPRSFVGTQSCGTGAPNGAVCVMDTPPPTISGNATYNTEY